MQQWHLFKHPTPSKERLAQEAGSAKAEADSLLEHAKRGLLLTKPRPAEAAAHINEWLASPGLRPPT
jgi:hypothetical protein